MPHSKTEHRRRTVSAPIRKQLKWLGSDTALLSPWFKREADSKAVAEGLRLARDHASPSFYVPSRMGKYLWLADDKYRLKEPDRYDDAVHTLARLLS